MRNRINCILLVVLFSVIPRCEAGSEFENAISEIADKAADILERKGVTEVVPRFDGLATMPGGGETGVIELLKDKLARHGVRITRRGKYALSTELIKSESSDGIELTLLGHIKDDSRTFDEEFKSRSTISDPTELSELLGVPNMRDLKKDRDFQMTAFRHDFNSKQFFRSNDEKFVVSDISGKFRLGLQVGGEHQTFVNTDGLPYTQLSQGDEYTLVLENLASHEVAVDVKIDGLNVFYFTAPDGLKPDGTKPKYWVVAPQSSLVVRGWYKNASTQNRFEVVPATESAAAKAGLSAGGIGLVTATFHASWMKNQKPPDDEPERPITYSVTVPLGTGRGQEFSARSQVVERITGEPRATLAFRYDRP